MSKTKKTTILDNLKIPPEKLDIKNKFKIRSFNGVYVWFDMREWTKSVENSSNKSVLEMLNRYYVIVEYNALKYHGKITSSLGDGVGVLFKRILCVKHAYDMVINTLETFKLKINGVKIEAGASLDYGSIVYGKHNKIDYKREIYTGKLVIRTFRISKYNSETKKEILVSEEFYKRLDIGIQQKFNLFGNVRLKGFTRKYKLYSQDF